MGRILFWGTIFLIGIMAFSQNSEQAVSYPTDYFSPPVNRQMYLSGTFGELRSNHFHSGIDIKAKNGQIGEPLLACADGFISRIKIQSGGYGNAIYIDHPNGYTTVYAHLQHLMADAKAYVKEQQYQKQQFEVDLYLNPDQIPVRKGQKIGTLGVSGRSFGPHLHFEIRDTKTEKPINPLLFGFKVTDKLPPSIRQIRLYQINADYHNLEAKTYTPVRRGSAFRVSGDTLLVGGEKAGIAIKCYDPMNGVQNWNGVYKVHMEVNGVPHFAFDFETFSFEETRYINAHLDYPERVQKRSYFNRCFRLPGNNLSIYDQNLSIGDGLIPVDNQKAKRVNISVWDVAGNKSVVTFWVKRDKALDRSYSKTFNYILPYNEASQISLGSFSVYIPEGALYQTEYISLQSSQDASYGNFSTIYHLHHSLTPLHKYIDISIKPRALPDRLKDKAFIALCDKGQKVTHFGGTWEDGILRAQTRTFGQYGIMVDTIPPRITPIRFSENLRGRSSIQFKVTDNLPVARHLEPFHFEATIDGQWVLLTFDAKNDLLTHTFDERTPPGEHELVLRAWDNSGNEKKFVRTFYR